MGSISESEKVREVLGQVFSSLPAFPKVVDWSVQLFEDGAGDPAVSITVLLDETTSDADWTTPNLGPIADRIREAIHASGINRWPYVRFARPSDMKAAG